MLPVLCVFVALTSVVFAEPVPLKCGSTPIEPNITIPIDGSVSFVVNGSIARPYSWPWQLNLDGCGGTILTEKWIMTAGHCAEAIEVGGVLKAGVFHNSQDKKEAGEQDPEIEEIHQHPEYDLAKKLNDITLVKLRCPLVFSDHIQPVCLPKDDNELIKPGVYAVVTGWGWDEQRHSPDRLRQALVHMRNKTDCDVYEQFDPLNHICSSDPGKDTCQGDSGGPHVHKCKKTGRWFQTGITSFGHGCAEPHYPGVYARVSHFCDFIRNTTGQDICI